MGKSTGIEWCDMTYNPWRGCVKISEGCEHCYAESQSKRNPRVLGEWGSNARRAFAAHGYLAQPFKWNADAISDKVRPRVFCGSLMDVWEIRHDLDLPRAGLLNTIAETPHIDWLLLSKRPENWLRCIADARPHLSELGETMCKRWLSAVFTPAATDVGPGGSLYTRMTAPISPEVPANVWIGTTVENQRRVEARCTALLKIPARVHFVSAEPLLDLPDLRPYLAPGMVNWVICGGESGSKARPFLSDWARVLLDQCGDAGISFFMKQMGDNADDHKGQLLYPKDDPWRDIPKDLRMRQFPTAR